MKNQEGTLLVFSLRMDNNATFKKDEKVNDK